MKVVVQRVSKASVSVDNQVVGSIKEGLMLLVGFTQDDTLKNIDYMVNKVLNLRIFPDEHGVMNKSVMDIGGSILSISQFTLYGDASKGNRPSYVKALKGEEAIKLYEIFNEKLKENVLVETGVFGADMQVELVNMGPTTIILEK
mgnify:CR=1 FL=1